MNKIHMTAFQERFFRSLYEHNAYHYQPVSSWIVAQESFAYRWSKRSARGILIAHIDRAAYTLMKEGLVIRLAPKDRFDTASYSLSELGLAYYIGYYNG